PAHELLVTDAKTFTEWSQVLFDQFGREAIVSGRHRSVGGEHNLLNNAADGLVWADTFARHAMPNQLEYRKCAVPLVQMNYAGPHTHRCGGAHAADAKENLLVNSDAIVTAVEA